MIVIEKVQRRAALFVLNNFRRKASVSEMLHNLGWQTFESQRQDSGSGLYSGGLTWSIVLRTQKLRNFIQHNTMLLFTRLHKI